MSRPTQPPPAPPGPSGPPRVVTYAQAGFDSEHEAQSLHELARRIAALQGWPFAGTWQADARPAGPAYFVPNRTLVGVERAEELGIRNESHLFGGLVPHGFVASKAITHALVDHSAVAPQGWSPAFGAQVQPVVLSGWSAFSTDDAFRAGRQLLEKGQVRLKLPFGIGGRGQVVVASVQELAAVLATVDPAGLAAEGLVVEENLLEVETFSVGQVRLAGVVASYAGVQRLTPAPDGELVYGGSDLLVVRGDFDALLAFGLPPAVALAVAQARAYDEAATRHFGLVASRRNYDVASGSNARGEVRSGVLEQSWRAGGASGVEIAAMEAFLNDPTLLAVRGSCYEVYGPEIEPPPRATVYYHGEDPKVGWLTKFTVVNEYVYPR